MHTHKNKTKKEEKQHYKAKAEKNGFILPLSVSIQGLCAGRLEEELFSK